jgi:GNAT superfamily N-acetyltransferase
MTPALLALRGADPDEAGALSDLALRSKGWWGYDEEFLASCRDELTLGSEALLRAVVATVGPAAAGFHLLTADPADPGAGELEMLFVDPPFIGTGVGRVLFDDAWTRAVRSGWGRLRIESDPYAEAFYLRMGAVQVGERPSASVPGRSLRVLEVTLDARPRRWA